MPVHFTTQWHRWYCYTAERTPLRAGQVPSNCFPSPRGQLGNTLLDNQLLVYVPFPWGYQAWGNLLSTYWQARGVADMFALQFVQSPPFHPTADEWISHLPTYVKNSWREPRIKLATELCNVLVAKEPDHASLYPHKFELHWFHIREAIQADTSQALSLYIESLPAEKRPARIGPQPKTIAVMFRCDKVTHFHHPLYGVYAFSVYNHVDQFCGSHDQVLVISFSDLPICDEIREVLLDHLKARCSTWTISQQSSAPKKNHCFQYFYSMYIADVLLGAYSTFSLHAALASTGHVIHAPMQYDVVTGNVITNTTWDKWTWATEPRLTPSVGKENGLDISSNISAISTWLKAN